MLRKNILVASLLLIVLAFFSCGKEEPVSPEVTQGEQAAVLAKEGDPAILAKMDEINAQLAASGSNLFLNVLEVFTIGEGRPSNRILQQEFRWVANDERRLADGENITYLVDATYQGTASGVSPDATEGAIDRSLVTWDAEQALQKVDIIKRADPGTDPTIFDEFFPGTGDERGGGPNLGFPFFADIVNAGWYPRDLFDALVPPDPPDPPGGDFILAFSVTFIFGSFDEEGNFIPSDINGDNYLDTALNEVYYNDNFGAPGGTREDNPWAIDEELPSIDIETVSLHENGHSLGIGHFGPPPDAVMNPVFAGIRQEPLSSDQAAMETIWSSWPND